jgi:hypothetical protein
VKNRTSQKSFEKRLDPGIRHVVLMLRRGGIETFESCQGGKGHCREQPFVKFYGEQPEGLKALSIAMYARLEVVRLARVWDIQDGEITGPWWELIFSPTKECD